MGVIEDFVGANAKDESDQRGEGRIDTFLH